jgi:hypothetical protein
MNISATPRFGILSKILISVSALIGLYVFGLFVARMAANSLYRGIEQSRATGLAAIAFPGYRSANELLKSFGNIVRAASLSVEAPHFEAAHSRLLEITTQAGGFLDQLKIYHQPGLPPSLEATIRVPANSLDFAVASLHGLGTIKQETQASENTHAEKDSLTGQLESKQAELKRLTDIVQHRTGSLNDTVQAEEKISQHRNEVGDIERQLKKLESRVEYALVELQLTERYEARLDWRAADCLSDLRSSSIEGVDAILLSFGTVLGFLLHYGLLILLWAFLLYWPGRTMLRRHRSGTVLAASTAA